MQKQHNRPPLTVFLYKQLKPFYALLYYTTNCEHRDMAGTLCLWEQYKFHTKKGDERSISLSESVSVDISWVNAPDGQRLECDNLEPCPTETI
jgi:hypothetical protein